MRAFYYPRPAPFFFPCVCTKAMIDGGGGGGA
jgi:hypothetical protein